MPGIETRILRLAATLPFRERKALGKRMGVPTTAEKSALRKAAVAVRWNKVRGIAA